ncbi:MULTISPECIES: YihY/virulence factor BrkB family protein [unclassified Arthrobacter]|uniref:YihY/virulence factor BrkB family protein n=1 Tax=unclassified Arthrobacter TaxID=235627 RepID=UPI001C862C81|nr:YihY/virulence factor BrkB family protein [Arthrobacter sp. MAHUQ-56]MBX7442843.1 YihY/virulence factor BrkB family protein [Arthrobacter sp. MAHUQ-56]
MEWNRVRRDGGKFQALMALVQWTTARLNVLRPMRAFRHYSLQHGPLLSAGIGFNMFFSITGLLATGFSVAGLVLRGQPALLDTIISSVATSAPGLLKINGAPGLVDPKDLLDPNGLGWTAVIGSLVTVVTSLRWIAGVREGLRGVLELPPVLVNPVILKLRDAGTLLLLGVALVTSAGASLVFGTAAGWVSDFLHLDETVAGPLTTSVKITVPLVLNWVTALVMYRLAAALKLSRRALLEGTILAAVGTTVLQVFSTELLAGASRNPILAPFAIVIGLLIWFNLVSQVYLVSGGWAAVREADLRNSPARQDKAMWGARQVQPGKVPVQPGRLPLPPGQVPVLPENGTAATVRRRGTGRPRRR